MSQPLTAAALVALIGATMAFRPTTPSADEAEIRQVIQYYFDGAPTVDRAFRPEARMFFARDGNLVDTPIAEYIARVKAGPASSGVDKGIESIDVSGTAAVAKLRLSSASSEVVDYMALLKVDGRWAIVNKIFHRDLKGPR